MNHVSENEAVMVIRDRLMYYKRIINKDKKEVLLSILTKVNNKGQVSSLLANIRQERKIYFFSK